MHNGTIVERDDPHLGRVREARPAPVLSGTPFAIQVRHPKQSETGTTATATPAGRHPLRTAHRPPPSPHG